MDRVRRRVERTRRVVATARRGPLAVPAALDPALVIDAETDVGALYLHRDDRVMTPLIADQGVWEAEETAFLRATLRPGDTFLDVGANVGYMTVLGGRSVGRHGRVVAVEPEPRNLALLRANLWRNQLTAEVLPLAAFSRPGFLSLVLSELNRGDHQVHEYGGEGPIIPCARLDHVIAGRIDVAKIDTQGVDHEVLEGMAGLISRNPEIIVLSEFWLEGLEARGIDASRVLVRYRELGFEIGLLEPGGRSRAASDAEVLDACRRWQGLYVNLVLARPGRH